MNAYGSIILATLLVIFTLEIIARTLNLRRLQEPPPPELEGVYEPQRLARARAYLASRTRFAMVLSTFSLGAFLAFWWLQGFAHLDRLTAASVGLRW